MPRCCQASPPTAGPSAIPLCVPSVIQPKADPLRRSFALPATYAPIAGRKSDEVSPERIAHPYSGAVVRVAWARSGIRLTIALPMTATNTVRRVPHASATAPNGRLKIAPSPNRVALKCVEPGRDHERTVRVEGDDHAQRLRQGDGIGIEAGPLRERPVAGQPLAVPTPALVEIPREVWICPCRVRVKGEIEHIPS